MAAALGVNTKLGLAVSNSGSPPADPTVILEITDTDIRETLTRARTDGLRGSVSVSGHRMRASSKSVSGGWGMNPTPTELHNILPWMLGGASSGSGTVTYPLAETLPFRDVFKFIPVGAAERLFIHRECVCQTATFSGSQGQPLTLRVDVLGKQRDDPPDDDYTWPALEIDLDELPWMFHEGVLTLASTEYQFRSFQLSINNFGSGDPARFLNSLTPTDFPRGDRIINLTINDIPWGDSQSLLNTLRAGDVAGTLVFTVGNKILTFSFPYLVPPSIDDPVVADREEIFTSYTLQAAADVSTNTKVDEMSVTIQTT